MKKQFVAATFLHHIDIGDIIYLRAPVSSLQMLHTVYHGAVRFITGCLCVSSLFTCRLLHWYSLIYISIIGLLLLPICHLNTVITASAHKPLIHSLFLQYVQDLRKRYFLTMLLILGTNYNRI